MTANDSQQPIDLRSDTVTRPDSGMLEAMAAAPVGDDVYGDDPTVNALQQTAAQMLGKEAALYLPSGTQSNLCAVMAHCGRGDEYIIGDKYHIYRHEAGGTSVVGSAYPFVIQTDADGCLDPQAIGDAIKADDPHYPVSRLLCLENTVSGKAIKLQRIASAVAAARSHGLRTHLDGARFFNAVTETGASALQMAAPFDTVSVCLSKGLGAPVGSVLVGDKDSISRAHRIRKMLGGGMRQAGLLAAAGLYALTENVDRLAHDHRRAAQFAQELNALPELWASPVQVHTNMVFIEPEPSVRETMFAQICDAGILCGKPASVKRLVIHKDINDTRLERTIQTFREIAKVCA